MNKIRKLVARKIKRKEITITAIANFAGCTRQTVYNFLDPTCPIGVSYGTAEAIAKSCGIRIGVISK